MDSSAVGGSGHSGNDSLSAAPPLTSGTPQLLTRTPPRPLTRTEVALVKSTAPLFAQHGKEITKLFYSRLFLVAPRLRNMFNLVRTHKHKARSANMKGCQWD
jgi:hypothetical protein